MGLFTGIQTGRLVTGLTILLVLATAFGITVAGVVAAEASERNPPELTLSLREAIQAAVDNNVNVKLLKERIAAAQAQANTSFGALLPNISGYASGRNQTVNLGAFGLPPDRLSGLGLRRSVTDPFEVYDARATLVQNIFSLSLIHGGVRQRAVSTLRVWRQRSPNVT